MQQKFMIYVPIYSWVNINNHDARQIENSTANWSQKKFIVVYISKLLNSFIISKCQDINGLNEDIKDKTSWVPILNPNEGKIKPFLKKGCN